MKSERVIKQIEKRKQEDYDPKNFFLNTCVNFKHVQKQLKSTSSVLKGER